MCVLSQGDRGDRGPRGLSGSSGPVGPAGAKVCLPQVQVHVRVVHLLAAGGK